MPSRDGVQLATIVLVAAAVLLALSQVDQTANAALARERSGATRGSILDRNGSPLAWMSGANGTAKVHYSDPALAQFLGYRDSRGGWTGLEDEYNDFLQGQSVREDWRTFWLHLHGGSVWGGDLQLTIDKRIQRAAEKALGKHWGAIVALDPSTGAVLALVSNPYCPPASLVAPHLLRRCHMDAAKPLLNRATQLLLPPGSIFKIVTLTAAIDTGKFGLATLFTGEDAFGPSLYFDNVTYPSNVNRSDFNALTLEQALAFSDNFAFAHIGLTLGGSTLLRYSRRYYVGRTIPFDFPVARSEIANGHARPSLAEIAQSSFGAEVDRVTPLQMALITSAVANHGVMMAPHLVEALTDSKGKVLWRFPSHPLSRVMSRRSATEVARGMEFVVDNGSGFAAQIPGVRVAGKTGTAASGGFYPHAWFISFAPVNHSRIAIAVLREFAGEAFQYAAPIAHDVMKAALSDAYKLREAPTISGAMGSSG